MRQGQRQMTVAELQALPVSVDLVTAGRAWQLGRTKAHELARAGEFPCPVLRLGNSYRVTRADLLRSLGISAENSEAGPASPATAHTNPPAMEGLHHGKPSAAARPRLRSAG